ncbi:hypothetical protein SAMN05518672_103358 [Chitinophaga sp. CF118]|nr:hypothetical protein SAMN05518672_103358 [Chitinophaga sp. CF118]
MFLYGCSSPEIQLSQQEKAFADSLKEEYECEVEMKHDNDAIGGNKTNGTLSLTLKNIKGLNVCKKDSAELKEFSREIVGTLIPVLSHKSNYASVVLEFYKSENPGKNERMICDRFIIVSTRDTSKASVELWY